MWKRLGATITSNKIPTSSINNIPGPPVHNIPGSSVGADLARPAPIYRPSGDFTTSPHQFVEPRDFSPAYHSAQEFLADLLLIQESLLADGEQQVAQGRLATLIRQVQVFGFHFAALDVRQHSERHASALAELLKVTGLRGDDYNTLAETERVRILANLLSDPRVLPRQELNLSEETQHVLQTFDAIRQRA